MKESFEVQHGTFQDVAEFKDKPWLTVGQYLPTRIEVDGREVKIVIGFADNDSPIGLYQNLKVKFG